MDGTGRLARGLVSVLFTALLVLSISGSVFSDQNNGLIVTASAGAGGSISPSGDVIVAPGGSQTFRMTPAWGYHVDDVMVDGVSVGAVRSYTFSELSADAAISVTFALDTHTIIASARGLGWISPRSSIEVPIGTDQVFTMTPVAGAVVVDVQVDGVSVGAVSSYTFQNVRRPHTIRATFALAPYMITASAGRNGTISPSGRIVVPTSGASQLFVMMPAQHYHIGDVLVDGISVGALPSYVFANIVGQHTIRAVFELDSNPIVAAADGNGSISPSGAVAVGYGAGETFTMTAEEGYHVADVLVDGVSVGATGTYTFAEVTAPHTISARSALDGTWTITTSAGAGGTLQLAGAGVEPQIAAGAVPVMNGNNQTFMIVPERKYYVADVLVDGISVGPVMAYVFTNIIADHSISASFGTKSYAIEAFAGANGSISPSGETQVLYNESQLFVTTPDEGYVISNVFVDDVSVGAVTRWTFCDITRSHTIRCVFSAARESDGDPEHFRNL